MRIRYLSLSKPQYSSNYFPYLKDYIDAVVAPGTEVQIVGARVGRIDSFRFWEFLDTISVLDSILEAEQLGFDAVAIGNVLDPGLREARSMVDIPVLGLGETSMLVACTMGSTFGLIGANRYFGGRFEENVAKYGLGQRLAGIETMSLTPHELDECFSDPSKREQALDSFREAARRTMDKGAEVIVPAGGRIAAFLNANDVRDVDGAVILDGTAALITQTEAAIRLRSTMGSVTSRRRLYARANPELIASAAAEYAVGYNMPALGHLSAADIDPPTTN